MTAEEGSMNRYEIYRDKRGTWRWRLVAKNQKIVADSAEGYQTRRSALRAAERVRLLAWKARVAQVEK